MKPFEALPVGTRMPRKTSKPRNAGKLNKLKLMRRQWDLYLLLLPPTAYIVIFKYIPMAGILMAFKNYNPIKGIWGSEWVGGKYFEQFFNSPYIWQTISNTVGLSVYTVLITFPVPILFALALNELRNGWFRRNVQLITYAPHFISTVVVVSMTMIFLHERGPLNTLLDVMGWAKISFLGDPGWFKTVYVGTEIWQKIGFSSIIFIAALSSIDPQLHEAGKIDGASRFKRIIHINIPGIFPTIVILLILNLSQLMDIGFEKVFLLQNPVNLSSSEIIATMVYKVGLIGGDFSYSTAVGFFNSVVNFVLIVLVNAIAKKLTDNSLW